MPRPLIPNRVGAILDAAESLVLRDGFDGVTVERIARRAGIGKGAIYREFGSKRELMDALLARCARRLVDQVRQRVVEASTPVGLSAAYRLGIVALLDDSLLTAAFLDDEAVLGSHMPAVGGDRYRQRFAWITEYVEALHEAGSLASDAAPEAISIALSSFTIGLLSASSVLGPLTRDQLAAALDVVTTLIERGLESLPDAGAPAANDAHLLLLGRMAGQFDADTEEHR
ncbi:TetR/AcrR family transcriptional regulator [Saccharopolyspora spinosa]|uniref:TetR family transcriptional regulator n=1 Tax=Saccharopolyspora spinosa TaxID=60894 RepID=A0A2N3Y251_SACSN|nr:TetR/AcrR family transcriptional regulator [Saccharopolyspora spinosa]PKW17004.1 TetR family transcriptional regulator [Saccharopolyspora spinosa]